MKRYRVRIIEDAEHDLIDIFQAGEYEDGVVSNSTWSTGDWNGNAEFDFAVWAGKWHGAVWCAVGWTGVVSGKWAAVCG